MDALHLPAVKMVQSVRGGPDPQEAGPVLQQHLGSIACREPRSRDEGTLLGDTDNPGILAGPQATLARGRQDRLGTLEPQALLEALPAHDPHDTGDRAPYRAAAVAREGGFLIGAPASRHGNLAKTGAVKVADTATDRQPGHALGVVGESAQGPRKDAVRGLEDLD